MAHCPFAEIADNLGTAPEDWYKTGSRDGAATFGFQSKSTFNKYRNAHRDGDCICGDVAPGDVDIPKAAEVPEIHKIHGNSREHCDVGPDGGEFTGIKSATPLTDWSHIFEKFGLSPDEFEIDGDTVRCSMWNQSAAHNGERDVITLYAYRAKFKRKAKADEGILNDLIANVRNWTPNPRPEAAGDPVTVVVGLADWQLGKGEGDGTPGTVKRLTSALAGVQRYIEAQLDNGRNIERIVLANLGDHIEAVQGSYANQPATVDLNLRDQLTLALEINMQWIRAMNDYAPVTYTATLCNHGQWARSGHDSVMGDADNATGFIGDQLQMICKHNGGIEIDFNIPREDMITTGTFSGVNLAMAHGHKISGNEATWLATQSQALTHRERFIPDLWLTAHRHHAQITDYGPYTRIQATTVDPGSKWLYDAKGVYSTPGVTVFLTGEHLPMKWDDYKVIV